MSLADQIGVSVVNAFFCQVCGASLELISVIALKVFAKN